MSVEKTANTLRAESIMQLVNHCRNRLDRDCSPAFFKRRCRQKMIDLVLYFEIDLAEVYRLPRADKQKDMFDAGILKQDKDGTVTATGRYRSKEESREVRSGEPNIDAIERDAIQGTIGRFPRKKADPESDCPF